MFFLTKNLGGYIFSVITAKSLSEMEIQNMIKALLKQKKTFFKYVIVLFIILSFTVLFFTSFLQFKLDEAKKSELLNKEQNLISTENTVISNRINRISGDLLYLADCFRLNDNENGNYSALKKQ